LLGTVAGILFLAAGFYLGLRFGPLPVAVADSAFPFERQVVKIPLRARIDREVKTAPFKASEGVFESGAQIYRERCSICHGIPGRDSAFARRMYPPPPQLWKKHGANGQVGVSEYDPGLAYWFVANGVRLTGMPSFKQTLSDTEMWQVSLLLKNANKGMPASVSKILKQPEP
jgi:mono/diheme cytochrome c family protein